MVKVIFQHFRLDACQRCAYRLQLREHIDTVTILFHHTCNAAHLSIHTAEPVQQLLLRGLGRPGLRPWSYLPYTCTGYLSRQEIMTKGIAAGHIVWHRFVSGTGWGLTQISVIADLHGTLWAVMPVRAILIEMDQRTPERVNSDVAARVRSGLRNAGRAGLMPRMPNSPATASTSAVAAAGPNSSRNLASISAGASRRAGRRLHLPDASADPANQPGNCPICGMALEPVSRAREFGPGAD